jgi:small subunit ribosomal protein S7
MRRRAADKRDVLPDPKFGDQVVSKFVNSLMREGKKSVAEGILYNAFDRMQKRTGRNPVEMFHDALANVRPLLEVRSRASAAPPTRCPSRSGRSGGRRSPRAG